MRYALGLPLLALILGANSVHAAAPPLLNYQGILKDNVGNPISGIVSIMFTIYDSETGGTAWWSETNPLVQVDAGQLNVVLGTINEIKDTVFAGENRWLGIKIGNDPELSPRRRLVSVGYAHRVGTVDGSIAGTMIGPAGDGPHLKLAGGNFSDLEFSSQASGRAYMLQTAPDGSFYLYDKNAQQYRLYVADNGTVGIGTSAPTSNVALHVEGNLRVKGGTALHNQISIDLTGNSGFYGRNAIEIAASPDNSEGMIVVNKPNLTIWSSELGSEANLKCANVLSNGDISVQTGSLKVENAVGKQLQIYPGSLLGGQPGIQTTYNGDPSQSSLELNRSGGDVKIGSGGVHIGAVDQLVNHILTVARDSPTDPISDAWTTYSSRRWKLNVLPLDGALVKVSKLRSVYFDWKESGKHDLGMIAEEVGTVIPEIVVYEKNGIDARSLDYTRLTAVLVEAIKELKSQNDSLSARILQVEKKLSK